MWLHACSQRGMCLRCLQMRACVGVRVGRKPSSELPRSLRWGMSCGSGARLQLALYKATLYDVLCMNIECLPSHKLLMMRRPVGARGRSCINTGGWRALTKQETGFLFLFFLFFLSPFFLPPKNKSGHQTKVPASQRTRGTQLSNSLPPRCDLWPLTFLTPWPSPLQCFLCLLRIKLPNNFAPPLAVNLKMKKCFFFFFFCSSQLLWLRGTHGLNYTARRTDSVTADCESRRHYPRCWPQTEKHRPNTCLLLLS